MPLPSETQDASHPGFAQTLCAPLGPASPSEFPVADWDRYVFIRRLGAGGMGEVFEARDLRLERVVALKFIRGGDPRLHLRLAQEARAQARIDHPNVCKVFEVGEVGGKAYIAMERVDGIPLGLLSAMRPRTPPTRCSRGWSIATRSRSRQPASPTKPISSCTRRITSIVATS